MFSQIANGHFWDLCQLRMAYRGRLLPVAIGGLGRSQPVVTARARTGVALGIG